MTDPREKIRKRWGEVFDNVVALYGFFRRNPSERKDLRRAALRHKEIAAEPIDFMIDVELKASRILSQAEYDMFLRLVDEDKVELVPNKMRLILGCEFLKKRLSESGEYRTLFYKTKQKQDRVHTETTTMGDAMLKNLGEDAKTDE